MLHKFTYNDLTDAVDSSDEPFNPVTLSFPTQASRENSSEASSAHVALNTAYNSLKTRLLRSEEENRNLQRRISKMTSHGTSSPKRRNSKTPQEDSPVDRSAILRVKAVDGVASQDGVNHQRHGSWGYASDRTADSNTNQYCRLLEIQLSKIEEERDRLRSELKDVRVKLTEQTLRSESTKHSGGEHTQQVDQLQQQVRAAELQVADAGHKCEMLQKQVRDAQEERSELKAKIRSLERAIAENAKQSRNNVASNGCETDGISPQANVTVFWSFTFRFYLLRVCCGTTSSGGSRHYAGVHSAASCEPTEHAAAR